MRLDKYAEHNETHASCALFMAVMNKFGEPGIIEMIAVSGYSVPLPIALNVCRASVEAWGWLCGLTEGARAPWSGQPFLRFA